MPKWKERYKETGYKESDLVNQATLSVLLTALRAYRENEDTGAATVEELKDLLGLMKSSSYVLSFVNCGRHSAGVNRLNPMPVMKHPQKRRKPVPTMRMRPRIPKKIHPSRT